MKSWMRAPFSIAAVAVAGSVAAHAWERIVSGKHGDDEWATFALVLLAVDLSLLAGMETLQVWQQLGLAVEGDSRG